MAVTIERDSLAGSVRICDLVVTNPAYRHPRLNHMPKDDGVIDEIKALEDRFASAAPEKLS